MAWEQLAGFIQEAADIDKREASAAPTTCAADYTTLKQGPDGTLFCPWCGLLWPDDASAWGSFPGSF